MNNCILYKLGSKLDLTRKSCIIFWNDIKYEKINILFKTTLIIFYHVSQTFDLNFFNN